MHAQMHNSHDGMSHCAMPRPAVARMAKGVCARNFTGTWLSAACLLCLVPPMGRTEWTGRCSSAFDPCSNETAHNDLQLLRRKTHLRSEVDRRVHPLDCILHQGFQQCRPWALSALGTEIKLPNQLGYNVTRVPSTASGKQT